MTEREHRAERAAARQNALGGLGLLLVTWCVRQGGRF